MVLNSLYFSVVIILSGRVGHTVNVDFMIILWRLFFLVNPQSYDMRRKRYTGYRVARFTGTLKSNLAIGQRT